MAPKEGTFFEQIYDRKTLYVRTFEGLLFFAPFAIWIVGTGQARNTVAVPRSFMYEIQPVFDVQGQVVYPGSAMSEVMNTGTITDLKSTNKFYGNMHALQTAKYGSMCYGNREDMHLSMQYHEDMMCEGGDPSNLWQTQDSNDKDKRELVRSLLLEKWQRETEGSNHQIFNSRTFCACIDEMHFSLVNQDTMNKKKKALLTTLATLTASNASYLATITTSLKNHTMYENVVLSQVDYAGHTDLVHMVQNMRSANLLLDTAELHLPKEDDVLQFCNRQALPTQTMKFSGIMDSYRYLMFGQFILLVSCLVSYEIGLLGWSQDENGNSTEHSEWMFENDAGDHRSWFSIIGSVLRALLYWTAWVLLIVDSSSKKFSDEGRLDPTARAQNPHGHTSMFSATDNIDFTFSWYIFGVVLVMTILECVKWWLVKSSKKGDVESMKIQSVVNRVIYTILTDVLNILSLTVISVGVQLQMGVKELANIYLIATVVACTAFIQHISNLISIYFDWIARTGNTALVVDESVLRCDPKTNQVLLRICYVRSGVFLFIALASVFVVAHVGVTRAVTTTRDVKSMAGLLFAIAFFVILCGFDFIYELFNIREGLGGQNSITSQTKRILHVMFVYSYIIFVNFVQSTQKFA